MGLDDPLSPLDHAVQEGIANGLFDDAPGQALVRLWLHGILDERTTAMIQSRVQRYRFAKAMSGCPLDRPRLLSGDLVLGADWKNLPVRIPLQYLNAHTLTVAGSGAGKTQKDSFLAIQAAPHVQGMLIVDLRKHDFRRLRHHLSRLGIDLIIVHARALKLNPLQVPAEVSPLAWAGRAAGMLVQVLALPPRASTTLTDKLIQLYRRSGAVDGGGAMPTLFDLYEAVASDSAVNPQARSAFLDALRPVLLSLGSVLAYQIGWAPAELACLHICLELGDVGEVEKDLILNYILTSEFIRRVTLGISNPQMDWLIFVDEAQRILSSSRHSGGIADLLCVVRGTGIGVSLSVQSTFDLHPLVLSNTALKWLGRVGSFTDASAIGAAMGLTAEQLRWAATTLRPGHWVCQVGEGTDRRPFFVRTPLLDLGQGAADSNPDSRQSLHPLLTGPTAEEA